MQVGLRIGFVSAGTLLILLIVGCCSFFSVADLIETDNWVTHTHVVLESLNSVLASATETQTSARGYLITGQKQYKDLNSTAVARSHETLKAIRTLILNDEKQTSRLDELADKIKGVVSFYAETISTYDRKGYEPAADMIRTGHGQNAMNDVRHLVEQMSHAEKALLEARMKDSTKSANHTHLTIIAGTLLAVAFVVLFGYLITRSITEPIQRLQRASENMERGRFDAIELMNTRDEFDDLGAAFLHLGKNLQLSKEKLDEEKARCDESERLLAEFKDKMNKLKQKIEELFSEARQHLYQCESHPVMVSAVNNFGTELSESARRVSELTNTSHENIKTCEHSIASFRFIQEDLNAQLSAIEHKISSTSNGITELADRIAELNDLIVVIDAVSAELNQLVSSETARKEQSPLIEQIKSISERSRQESIKLRQMLFRADKTASKAAMICDDALINAQKANKDSSVLTTKLESTLDLLAMSKKTIDSVVQQAAQHFNMHLEIPQKLDKVENAIKEHGEFVRFSELKAQELLQITNSADPVLDSQKIQESSVV